MVLFDDFIYWLDYYAVADVLLPFILVFTIVYAVLQKSKILGKDSKNFNIIISLVLGLGVVIPHVLGIYPGPSAVDIINAALPQISVLIVFVILFLIVVGVWFKDVDFGGASITGWAVLLSLVAVILIFGSAAGWFLMPNFLYFLSNPEIQSLVVIILVFGLLIWFITHEPGNKKDVEGFFDKVGRTMGEWGKKR